ncbi:MAG: DUF4340 domain-containing protein [Firmicutes bacterium]|nr:DUF4340 domain-containing protein [Bacillota bacterium]
MKKRLAGLLVGVGIVGVLATVYFTLPKQENKGELSEESTEITTLITDTLEGENISPLSSVNTFTLKNQKGTVEVYRQGNKWVVKNCENANVSQTVLDNIAALFTDLRIAEKLQNEGDISKFGFGETEALAEAVNEKGEHLSIHLGTNTVDGKYTYIYLNEDNKSIYTMADPFSRYLNYGIEDIVEKNFAKIEKKSITYLDIKRKGKDEMLVVFDPSNAVIQDFANTGGMTAMVMKKPLNEVVVYPDKLQQYILKNTEAMKVSSLVSPQPNNIADYGLEEPYMVIEMEDEEGTKLKVEVGDSVQLEDTDYRYVKVNEGISVFLMEQRYLQGFEDAYAPDIIQPFIALHIRRNVENIILEKGDEKYFVDFRAEGENKIFTDEEGVLRDNRNTYINDKKIEKKEFSDFYEAVVGLSFDDVVENAAPTGEPVGKITFKLTDGTTDTEEFYDYDTNFYRVKKGEDASFIIDKQDIQTLLTQAKELSKGNL